MIDPRPIEDWCKDTSADVCQVHSWIYLAVHGRSEYTYSWIE